MSHKRPAQIAIKLYLTEEDNRIIMREATRREWSRQHMISYIIRKWKETRHGDG